AIGPKANSTFHRHPGPAATSRSADREREVPGADAATGLLEHFHGCERLGRPWPETVQRELCLLSGLHINQEVAVLLLRRLALPIKVSRIVRSHLDGRAARKNWVLLRAAAAQQQILHAVHLV